MRRALILAVVSTVLVAAGVPASAQVQVIRADGPPAWGTNVRLMRSFAVGSLDGPPEYAFGSVHQVVGEKGGGFYVHDFREMQVRRYDAAGRFVTKIGRKGNGPGEYQQLLGMAVLGDSLLVTWDPPNARATVFDRDGTVRSSFTAALGGVSFGPNVFGLDNADRVYLQKGIRESRGYIRYRIDGTILDTLPAAVHDGSGFVIFTADGARSSFGVSRVITPNTSGGLLVASPDTLGFSTVGVRNPITVVRRHVPVRLGAAERREWEALAETFFKMAKLQRPPPGSRRPEPMLARIPRVKPAVRAIRADRDGRIWLEVYTRAEQREVPSTRRTGTRPQISWHERNTFEVFSPSGQYLGRLALPAEHQLLDARGDRVWALTYGPNGEEQIVVFQIAR
jgi:hypothetical protein